MKRGRTKWRGSSLLRPAAVALAGLLLSLAACALPDPPAEFNSGEWQVRTGFSPEFLRDTEMNSPEWRTISLPVNAVTATGDPDYRGAVTLRRELPPAFQKYLREGRDLGFFSGRVGDVVEFYINERRLGGVGSLKPYRYGSSQFFLGRIRAEGLEEAYYLTVVLHATDGSDLFIGWDDDLAMGDLDAVYFQFYGRELVNLFLIGVYVAAGFYHLLLWLLRREELYTLYFGLFCLVICVFWMNLSGLRVFIYGDAQALRFNIDLWLLLAAGPLLIFFFTQLFGHRHGRFGLVYAAFSVLLGIAAVFVGPRGDWLLLRAWHVSAIAGLVYIAILMIREFRAGVREARLLSAGVLLMALAIVHDILSAQGVVHTTQIGRFVFMLFVSGIASILAYRFQLVHRELAEFNVSLEERVADRTRLLERTLDDVRSLKIQQDGDYFLTSLLLEPLGRNLVDSERVKVDTLTRQAKRFEFRQRQVEIGGDLCAADVIVLRGRRYIVVLNGDAMGKSIQGAGGALVLGTAFKSLLDRTRVRSELRRLDPELWLKQCLDELHGVFVTFDGSMMVSLVLGLVDEASGLFYYLNAEHPFVVLYRDGRADFIEHQTNFRKLGVSGLDGGVLIRTFALLPDDVLFIGSDGRDDLLVGQDEYGNRLINENQDAFLGHIQEAGGDLNALEGALRRSGELMDDLSLIRLGFREDAPRESVAGDPQIVGLIESARAKIATGDLSAGLQRLEAARGRAPDDPDLLHELALAYASDDRYDRALEIGRLYANLNPADGDFLYSLADWAARLGDDREAARFAERLRLRQPEHLDCLVFLMDAYVRLGRVDFAARFADRVLAREPEHPDARRMQAMLADSTHSESY